MDFWVSLIVIELLVLAFALWIAWSGSVGAPWIPTPKSRVRNMLEMARVNSDDVVYDLGSGDGRIVVMAAKEFKAKAIGIEIDPVRVLWSKLMLRRHRIRFLASFIRGNFFKIDLSEATVVTLYQGHEINKKIRNKLSDDLKKGTRVVSYRFILDGWNPVKIDDDTSTYLYVV